MRLTTDLNVKHARLPTGMAEKYVAVVGHTNLCLRIRPTRKDWYFRYRPDNGAVRKIALGTYPAVGLAEAKDKADALRKQHTEGIDPQSERKRIASAKLAEKAVKDSLPQTVEELFNLWERRELTRRKDGGRKDNGEEARRKFKKDVFPRIGALPLDTLRRAHVIGILDDVKERGAPRIAGIILSEMRQMFAFAVDREIMAGDPTAGMKKSRFGGAANERERALGEDEVRQLAKALPPSLNQTNQRAIWIMLGACCRIGEITRARWEHVDLDAGAWTIPPDNSKNGKAHVVNLSDFVLEQFNALQAQAKADAKKADRAVSPWVMPARHNSGYVSAKSLAKQVGDRQRSGDTKPMSRRSPLTHALILPGGKWTPHDLRRTGATLMGSLGVRPDVIERCLNHTEQNKLQRIYQRAELRPEMKQAWQLLGDRLELLTNASADNIFPIKGKSAA